MSERVDKELGNVLNDWEILAQVAYRFGWDIKWENGRPYSFRKLFGKVSLVSDAYGGFAYSNYREDMNVKGTYLNLEKTISILIGEYEA